MPRKGTPRKPGVTPRYATDEELAVLAPKRKHLNTKHIKFLELIASGMSQIDAGMSVGLKSSNSRYRCLTNPLAQQYLSGLRTESRAIAAYNIAEAMQEAKEARDFAIEHENPMAVVKATELRAKLSGLLIDKVEVATFSINDALDKAKQRAQERTQLVQVQSPMIDVSTILPSSPCG